MAFHRTRMVTELPAWVEIDLDKLAANIRAIRRRLPVGCRYCAVVKSDAYGHGIEMVAPVLAAHGVDFAAVATNDEAFALRRAGFAGRLMRVRGATVSEAEAARPTAIEELVPSPDFASAIADGKDPRPVHLPINAMGMGREGLELTTEIGREAAARILATPGIRVVGITTHYPMNTPEDLAHGRARFLEDVEWVIGEAALDRDAVLVHAASSLGLLAGAGIEFDMVRSGACLWGIVGPRPDFADTMTLKSRITSVNHLPAGATVGYDRIHRLARDSRIANISIGYANGVRRDMANRATVLVRGRRAPVLGRISMNALAADVTEIAAARPDDEVVLFGAQGDDRITRAMVEAAADTIMADLYCDWGRSNPRRYRGGRNAGSAPDA